MTENYLTYSKTVQPMLEQRLALLETSVQNSLLQQHKELGADGATIIRIPVVVHVLYHTSEENIPESQIISQIKVLNQDYNRQNADTTNTPERFKGIAANCQIQFVLASADPNGRATTGIVRKYTSNISWNMDDKMKRSANGGNNAWDSKSYLNIWVCNLRTMLGYASVPGADAAVDGVAMNYTVFGTGMGSAYNLGRTATHEVGHWMGLKHIWGDTYCGDDLVGDTPKQGNFTQGCPGGFRSSCSNGTLGDMYMNFMDYTNDACLNMFTEGQKARMRAYFDGNSARASLLVSKGLAKPWNNTPEPIELPAPDLTIRWSAFPNPAASTLNIKFENAALANGASISIMSAQGQLMYRGSVTNGSVQNLDLSKMASGMYLVVVEKDGERSQSRIMHQSIQ